MHLYRHHKGQAYRYRGIVRHSETLEEMVAYDCLYDNELGRSWVRPRPMFFENVSTPAGDRPRFCKVDLQSETFASIDAALVTRIIPLARSCLSFFDEERFRLRCETITNLHFIIARVDEQDVAFKLGYEESPGVFYSWLGGVIASMRGLGIADDLMEQQHQWCRQQNFGCIRTKTLNTNSVMLKVNLEHGFLVVGTEASKLGLKVLLEKIPLV